MSLSFAALSRWYLNRSRTSQSSSTHTYSWYTLYRFRKYFL